MSQSRPRYPLAQHSPHALHGAGLLQITFLLARSSPLTLDGRPHPAAPVHIDSARKSAVDKQGVDPSRRFHELEIQVAALDANITVLKKTLEARAQARRAVDFPATSS